MFSKRCSDNRFTVFWLNWKWFIFYNLLMLTTLILSSGIFAFYFICSGLTEGVIYSTWICCEVCFLGIGSCLLQEYSVLLMSGVGMLFFYFVSLPLCFGLGGSVISYTVLAVAFTMLVFLLLSYHHMNRQQAMEINDLSTQQSAIKRIPTSLQNKVSEEDGLSTDVSFHKGEFIHR